MSGFSTRAVRAASRVPRVAQEPTAVPIYQTATFATADADELALVTTGEQHGYSYSRIGNPTVEALADAIADLESAEAGFALASGMAAIYATMLSLVSAGDRIVSTRAIYGTTGAQFRNVLSRLGVSTEFVDITDHAAVEVALAAAPTRVLYAETISNPTALVADHVALGDLARRHGAAYVVDNTFASPYACRPLELGADVVVESATKYLGGHSDVIAGVVAGSRERIAAIRSVQVDTGATLAPFSAFLVLRGIATLAIRVERHSATARALAAWLERQEGVLRVNHPALESHPQYALASRQLDTGGGMLSFELAGGPEVGPAFIDGLSIAELTASLGSVHTMVVHPPTTSHRQLSEDERRAAGIGPGLLRVSVGLEDLDDLIGDFERGLAAARAVAVRQDTEPVPAPTA